MADYQYEQTDTHTRLTGRADTLLEALEARESSMGHLVLGLVMAMHSLGRDTLDVDLDGETDLDHRPLDLVVAHSGEQVTLRFLDTPDPAPSE